MEETTEHLKNRIEELEQDVCYDCDDGWKEDRAGKYVCSCVSERGPFIYLLDILEKIKRVSSGENQVSEDDTEGMSWIRDYIEKQLNNIGISI